jgi:hypothetical protein
LPLTVALGSPAGALVLFLYTRSIKKHGSRYTLRVSNLFCCIFFGAMTFFTAFYGSHFKSAGGHLAIVSFYAFREIYVSLLSTQHWAFIASHLDRSNSSYLVTFTGVVSIASAAGGIAIEHVVYLGGVKLLMMVAFLAVMITFICSEVSYFIVTRTATDAESYSLHPSKSVQSLVNFIGSKLPPMKMIMGSSNNLRDYHQWTKQDAIRGMSSFASRAIDMGRNCVNRTHSAFSPKSPQSDAKNNHNSNTAPQQETDTSKSEPKVKSGSTGIKAFFVDSWSLMCKHPILQLLFVEAITHQMCTNMLNLMFHNGLGVEVGEDSVRAMLVGRFFATVNITACSLQFFILPGILQNSLPSVLSKIPFIVFVAVMLGVIRPGLISVMLGFGTIKVLEYSIMTAASEMIYMPMGHEVRYLGKELIKFFGHKLGKSASSLILSGLIAQVRPSLATQSMWGAIFAVCWGVTMHQLAQFLIRRDRKEVAEKQADKISTSRQVSSTDTGCSFQPISDKDVTSDETTSSNSSPMNNGTLSNCTSFDSLASAVSFDRSGEKSRNGESLLYDIPTSPSQDVDFFEGIFMESDDNEVNDNNKVIEKEVSGKITPLVVGCEFLPLNSASHATDHDGVTQKKSHAHIKHALSKQKTARRSPKVVKKKSSNCTKPILFRVGSNQINLNSLQLQKS